jgi:hypothetical protein
MSLPTTAYLFTAAILAIIVQPFAGEGACGPKSPKK